MNKLFNKIKDNNKGFTLVELIVVIAVLAVITVVAAPSYLSYVEKSKAGTDENALGEIAHVAEIEWVGIAAVNGKSGSDKIVTINIDATGNAKITGKAEADKLDAAVEDMLFTVEKKVGDVTTKYYNYVFKSEEYRGKNIQIELDDNGVIIADTTTKLPFSIVK